ncbi:hypothetical protein, partial [Rhodococcus sp. KRD162]|uniref:hypothetical protein n=1 Tax=Rhodococcus sp. KRD162 TaxID=2729725 RepID=UPI0019CF8F3D
GVAVAGAGGGGGVGHCFAFRWWLSERQPYSVTLQGSRATVRSVTLQGHVRHFYGVTLHG